MAGIKSLAKDTAIYGLSSILGRFLNWCLVPLYVYLFAANEYGIVSYLYSFTAVALVILNYGMETGFFRYANKDKDPEKVYTTSLISVGSTSLIFIILLTLFLHPLSDAMLLPRHSIYVWLLGVTVAIDAFSNLPFAYLRYKNKALHFAGIKLFNVFFNIALNLFFLLGCPAIEKSFPGLISWFYQPAGGAAFGIGWIFVANILSTVAVGLLLLPQIAGRRWRFDATLLRSMLSYSWPLLILGVAGILSQNMGQLMIPYIFKGEEEAARSMVGIYGANIKIAIVMVMFTQAFRYAYEPFIFAQAKASGEDKKQAYCDAMKYFWIFGLWIFLGVMFFLPVLKHFVAPSYWAGLKVVPVMMAAELCFGVFFNLSLWYKLTDRTRWGMYFSIICFLLMFGLNLWLVPAIGIPNGYMGSAWAALISYFLVMLLSYFVGRHYYPLPYPIGKMGRYLIYAAIVYGVGMYADFPNMMWLSYLFRSAMLILYAVTVVKNENLKLPGR
ncbi:MAG: polysaccharide biosynthesis C-terminal domain-containing protein [Muribaculaceae bacterium]|nr:polysaccharide biosynthesis C-terminal domain-containing protein [Muribaculaceae bacterium]